ncbi:MAG: S41 family peptidase [Muribaculaceae bacterium]|nr:S41 family peptidase [Muribaculaceae bacterium]
MKNYSQNIRIKINRLFITLCFIIGLLSLSGCHDEPDFSNTPSGNLKALSHIIATRYCFLEEKGVDWDRITEEHLKLLSPNTTDRELFKICADMLATLKDGHVNLSSRFNTSYYRKWWTDYPQNFNLRTLEENYLNFEWNTTSGMYYKILNDDFGYIYYPSFSYSISETSLNYIFAHFYKCKALIIDIRDNGGGQLTNVNTLVGRFINQPFVGGYLSHKTGPGISDFSEPYPVTYKPSPEGAILWERPVYILTNRSCFSAANNFVAVMKDLPQVTIVGGRTGGGGGMPFSSELPNGWSVRFSACPMTDANGNSIENGIDPDIIRGGSEEEYASGNDPILDYVLSL